MPFYNRIRETTPEGRRIIDGLLRLKDGLAADGVPARSANDTLMLATWNLREFGPSKFGLRPDEPLYYLAEVIDRFDLVALQEVRDDLSVLNRLMSILGRWWKVLLTDVTEGRPGNRERMAFLYDSRKVEFGGLAGEVVLPPTGQGAGNYLAADQLARTPYLAGFRVGWFRFTLCPAHILYGEDNPDDARRVQEIRDLSRFLAARTRERHAWAHNMVLLGDFNIFDPGDITMEAITEAGFFVPEALRSRPSNAPRTKHYDQIAFIAPQVQDQLALCNAGVFPFFDHVYRPEDEAAYAGSMGDAYRVKKGGAARSAKERTTYYNNWRTFQMSDHLPMWIELRIDFSAAYFRAKRDRDLPPEPDDDSPDPTP